MSKINWILSKYVVFQKYKRGRLPLILLFIVTIFFQGGIFVDVSVGEIPRKNNYIVTDPSFFPLAVWIQNPKNADAYQELGINLYVGLWKGPTPAQLLLLKQVGMPVICHQNFTGLTDQNRDIIVGWMQKDEPDNKQKRGKGWGYNSPLSPLELVSDLMTIRKNDSTRPVLLNLGQGVAWDHWRGRGNRTNHPEDYPAYIRGGDIISFDIYPVTHKSREVKGKLEYIAKGVKRLKSWASSRQRVWNVIGVSRINNPYVKPSMEQVRSQVWMSIIHGSQGIIYFVHQFKPVFIEAALLQDTQMQQGIKVLNGLITDLAPVLNGPDTDDILEIVTNPGQAKVVAISKRLKCFLYVFSISMQDQQSSMRLKLKYSALNQLVDVIGEGRKIPLRNGVLLDSFGSYEPHLYQINGCFQ